MPTYMQGALRSGTTPSEHAPSGVGSAIFVQSATLQAASATNVDATIRIPPNSQIIEILVDTPTAWTATGAVTLTAGITAGGTEYITSVDLKTAGRGAPTLTAAQVGAMFNVGSNTNVVFRAATASGANNTGTTRVTVLYVPRD